MNLSEKLEIVNEFRESVPVDVEGLARALGLVVHRAFLSDDLSGMLAPMGEGTYRITVNAHHPPTRQRFTIAHELGHFLLHKHLIGSGVDDDGVYRSTSAGVYKNIAIGPKEETEANKVATTILMPYDLIERFKKDEGVDTPKRLAEAFGVSEHAMSIRLRAPYVP